MPFMSTGTRRSHNNRLGLPSMGLGFAAMTLGSISKIPTFSFFLCLPLCLCFSLSLSLSLSVCLYFFSLSLSLTLLVHLIGKALFPLHVCWQPDFFDVEI